MLHARELNQPRISNELNDIKQRNNVVRDLVLNSYSKFELILSNVYKIIIDICEEAKLLREKKELQEVRELLTELLNQIDARLQNAESELRELNASFKKLVFNTLIDVDPQVLNEDNMDIINQFNAIVNKVNDVNKRNAQILSSSLGQEVSPIKVETKVESTPGASSSEFMKNVVITNDNLKDEQEIVNDYYESFTSAEDGQKFEEKNKSLERSKGVRFGLEDESPAVPDESRRNTYGIDENSIPQSNLPNVPNVPNRSNVLNVPHVPTQGFRYSQLPAPANNTAVEKIQEEVKYNVINVSAEMMGIVKEEAEKYPEPPKTYDDYRMFLHENKLEEYFDDETGECDYFYYWYRILSAKELPETMTYGRVYAELKSFFTPGEMEDVNVLLSLFQRTYESTDFDAMETIRNSYAELILVMAIRNGLLTDGFRNGVNYADLFDTFEFENSIE